MSGELSWTYSNKDIHSFGNTGFIFDTSSRVAICGVKPKPRRGPESILMAGCLGLVNSQINSNPIIFLYHH
jgi:hypothetical protein